MINKEYFVNRENSREVNKLNRPNLFNYATSELSQDAFLCWLLEWANPQYKAMDEKLHLTALQFITEIFTKHGMQMVEIDRIEIIRQQSKIDVLAVINHEIYILIEDKTYTKEHSDQLNRYRKTLYDEGKDKQLPIYYKIGNQGNYEMVKKAGFELFGRKEMLTILETGIQGGTSNPILVDYYEHLKNIDAQHESYQKQPLATWGFLSWHGFYSKLQEEGIHGHWDYVANPRGGFNGFWWHWKDADSCRVYLQLENEKLCCKIQVKDKSKRSELRSLWSKIILEHCNKLVLSFIKPERFGNGEFMTVAILDEYRTTDKNGMIDLQQTLATLKKAETMLDDIVSHSSMLVVNK